MTNHVHVLATPRTPDGVSRMMQRTGRHYVRYFNRTYWRSGTLWEGRFRSCAVDAEQYLLTCQRYIELNPVRANMVPTPADYRWSSYRCNGLGLPSRLWSPHELYLRLGASQSARVAAYQGLFEAHVEADTLNTIRTSTQKGLALGSERFKAQVEALTGREMEVLALLDRRLTNQEIARELVITVGTVKQHTNSIYGKLGVGDRRLAVARARSLGLLPHWVRRG